MNKIIEEPADFFALHSAFTKSLAKAFELNDVQILRSSFDTFIANSDQDKKSPMDQAFRELLLLKLNGSVEDVGALIKLSVGAVRDELVSVTIPVVLLSDIFETVTLDKCEQIFNYVEDMVEIWKEDIFFSSCKNNILRMCNDLLRRLSRAQNTVFCGRILLFLSKFFPFSERSGLNIVSEFNLDNVTDYGVDGKDLDETLEDIEDLSIKIDYNLYCKFWSLQDFFRNPNQCYSKASWKMFQIHATTVLDAFSSFKLEDPRLNCNNDEISNEDANYKMDIDINYSQIQIKEEMNQSVRKVENFFAKFLTNPKLLALQLSDTQFRRAVLLQFLILFQYLQITVKFKAESNNLTAAQTEFIKETETRVFQLLEETPPNGKRFARTVKHMLTREEMWNNWKNEGCKDFKKPEELHSTDEPPAKKERKPLGDRLRDAVRQGRFFMGNEVLTRLWNYSPDNLQACKSEERNFLPQVEQYLESSRDKNDTSFEWRALRLLARQSPHFFTFINSPSYKISDYLDAVRKRLLKERLDLTKSIQNHLNNNGTNNESVTNISETNEQETVALQEQEGEQETNGEDGELDDDEDNHNNLDKAEDESNTHTKPITANREQIEELAPLIGDDWKKLGKKLGYTTDELLYFETEHTDREGGCVNMLVNWFNDDDDASLDNLAYVMEGLEINTAAKAVKALIERLTKASNCREENDTNT